MTDSQYPLRFGPGVPTGFTPAGISGFADLRPPAVVRELIQNSLDAAAEANRTTAVVRFRLSSLSVARIPGIREFRAAFTATVRSQKKLAGGNLSSQAEHVVETIHSALSQGQHDALYVVDNGIGLDRKRMSALLSDGISAKQGESTGTFGNGHSVVIPASDLRYILYGGIAPNGDRIGSGHAVLASRVARSENHPIGADGFLISQFSNGTMNFFTGHDTPELIGEALGEIESLYGCGSVVIVPCFNSFRQDADLQQVVFSAAACNFFKAIGDGQLEIHYEDARRRRDGEVHILNQSTLDSVLHQNKEEMRSRSFLSGHRSFEARQALCYGSEHLIETCLGPAHLHLHRKASGTTRIDICRNGMWITDDKGVSQFAYQFQDREPFHAVLALQSGGRGRLHEVVRNAEGPLHDKLDVKQRLGAADARQLRQAFREIRDWLLEKVPAVEQSTYSPDDFLALDFGDGFGGGTRQASFWGVPVAATRRDWPRTRVEIDPPDPPDPDDDDPPIPDPPRRPRPRPVLRSFFRAVAIPTGLNQRRVHVECLEACRSAEFRLCIDENLDATCDPVRRDEIEAMILRRVSVNGERVTRDRYVRLAGRPVGVRLGDLGIGDSLQVEVQYEIPNKLLVLPGVEPSFRVELFRSPPESKEENSHV